MLTFLGEKLVGASFYAFCNYVKDLQNVSKYELQKMKAHYLFNEIQFATCLLVLLQLDEDAVDHTTDWSARVD